MGRYPFTMKASQPTAAGVKIMDVIKKPLPGLEDYVNEVEVADQGHPQALAAFLLILDRLPWADRFVAEIGQGWGWRKAAYIAWASMPANLRSPKTLGQTKDGENGLAQLLGLRSEKAFARWRKDNPAIDQAVARFAMESVMAATPDIVNALIESASNPSYKHAPDRKIALAMSGLYQKEQTLLLKGQETEEDMAQKSDEELERLAAMGGPDVVEGEFTKNE